MKNVLSVLAFAGLVATASCNNVAEERQQASQQRVIDSMRTELAHQQTVDSLSRVAFVQQKTIESMKVTKRAPATRTMTIVRTYQARPRTVHYARTRTYRSNSYAAYNNYAPVAVQPRKRGWSAKAKGAVIGTGVGAVTGAIVNGRNRGVGALIGGLSGAAVGTGVGAIIDHRNGR